MFISVIRVCMDTYIYGIMCVDICDGYVYDIMCVDICDGYVYDIMCVDMHVAYMYDTSIYGIMCSMYVSYQHLYSICSYVTSI